jgi:hypothetical protein
MRIRLREARPAAEEAAYYRRVYPQGYRHDAWPDHVERVEASIGIIQQYRTQIRTAADLSCGDGAILRGLDLEEAVLGDLNGFTVDSAEWPRARVVRTAPPGPLPDTLDGLEDAVDLFVLSETLEHMDDPDGLLRQLTGVSRYLFLSTPISEIATSGNLEHYWSWGTDDLYYMLQDAGWLPLEKRELTPVSTLSLENAYRYQMWMAVSR